jgi:hypothetical protein
VKPQLATKHLLTIKDIEDRLIKIFNESLTAAVRMDYILEQFDDITEYISGKGWIYRSDIEKMMFSGVLRELAETNEGKWTLRS